MLPGGVGLLHTAHKAFPVIFDSGASKALIGFKSDFVREIIPPPIQLHLGGMADGM